MLHNALFLAPPTTTPATPCSCNDGQNNSSSSDYWAKVGADLVSLLFHDLILLVVFAIVLLVIKFAFNYQLVCCVTNPTAANPPYKIDSMA